LINVLCGHMSLVGPRPPLASEVEQYSPHQFIRLKVLPGITGLWQIKARRSSSFHDYITLDAAYIQNWCLWLDIKILWSTIGVVLAGTGD
jgi:lipopolysaccharide/colanic/teichoic acid biosynthesis glycosyltransferase